MLSGCAHDVARTHRLRLHSAASACARRRRGPLGDPGGETPAADGVTVLRGGRHACAGDARGGAVRRELEPVGGPGAGLAAAWGKVTQLCSLVIVGTLIAFTLLHSTASVAESAEYRWRVSDNNGRLRLFAAEFDATDAPGVLTFSCRRGSGSITFEGMVGQDDRQQIAALIREDKYPRIVIGPTSSREKTYLKTLTFTETDGWLYAFDVSAESSWFRGFMATGTLTFHNWGSSCHWRPK